MTNVGRERTVALEPVVVVESGTWKLFTTGAVGSLVTTKRIRSQELCSAREALFQAHEQPFVLRDAGRVIECDRPCGTDCGNVLLLSGAAGRNHWPLRAAEAVIVDSR